MKLCFIFNLSLGEANIYTHAHDHAKHAPIEKGERLYCQKEVPKGRDGCLTPSHSRNSKPPNLNLWNTDQTEVQAEASRTFNLRAAEAANLKSQVGFSLSQFERVT